MLLLYIMDKNYLNKAWMCFEDLLPHKTSGPLKVTPLSLPSQTFVLSPCGVCFWCYGTKERGMTCLINFIKFITWFRGCGKSTYEHIQTDMKISYAYFLMNSIPWSRVLLEKLSVTHLVKKFLALLCGTRVHKGPPDVLCIFCNMLDLHDELLAPAQHSG
jgi:hypothetical protein